MDTHIEDTVAVQAQEMLVMKTLPGRSTQSVTYSENSRGTPFSAQLGTASRLLQETVSRVANGINDIARTPQRKEELMHGLIHHPQFQAAIQAEGMPSRSDWLITEGVKGQLQEFKQDHLHKTVHGRVASNAVIRAAVCKMGQLAEHGHTELVRNRLGYSRTGLDNALKRLHDQTVFDLLDPHREERCDALTADDLLLVESAWEMFTDPDPVLTMNIHLPDGHRVTKAVHHKKDSGDDIFDKANSFFKSSGGMPCRKTKFKELKPAWIWEETFATCLCPYCFEMRLYQAGYVGVMRKAARPENLCVCEWCLVQKQNGRDGIPPPYHAKFVAAKRYCESEEGSPHELRVSRGVSNICPYLHLQRLIRKEETVLHWEIQLHRVPKLSYICSLSFSRSTLFIYGCCK